MASKKSSPKVKMPTDESLKRLDAFLSQERRPEQSLSLSRLQGFLFAVSCSPYEVDPEDWLPVIFNEQDPNFQDEEEANAVFDVVLDIYDYLDQQVEEHKVALPASCVASENLATDLSKESLFSQWCSGFLIGHGWLDECWEELPEDLDEEIGSCMMVLSFHAERDLAEEYHDEFAEAGESLDDMATAMLEEFDEAMIRYADIGALLRGENEE